MSLSTTSLNKLLQEFLIEGQSALLLTNIPTKFMHYSCRYGAQNWKAWRKIRISMCPLSYTVIWNYFIPIDESLVSLLKSITIEDPQQIEIICRVYNANTNALIQSTSAPLTRDIRLSRRSRLQEFSSEQVTLGASIRLEVTADSNCFLYILNIGTSGNTTLLLPNEYERNNQFSANQTYYLPDKDYGFEISGPPGKETIQIMAFSNRLDMLDKMAVTTVQEREIYRDITIRRKKRIADTTEKKGYAQIQFSVT